MLIGETCLDVTLFPAGTLERKLRLGGVVHAARCLWGLGASYQLAYLAPSYLFRQIEDYALAHGCSNVSQIATIEGAPCVMLIEEATEAGSQGYDYLLRDELKCDIDTPRLESIVTKTEISDILVFPGNYDLAKVLVACSKSKARIHIDIANGVSNLSVLKKFVRKFDTVITSTSSEIFLDKFKGSPERLCQEVLDIYGESFLLKENRGGSRFYSSRAQKKPIEIGAQLRPIVHSVGVGDAFDAAFVNLRQTRDDESALTCASWIAAEYAATTFMDDFTDGCSRVLALERDEILSLPGVSLPWEVRSQFNIYIAAPDFDYLDRTHIDRLVSCLKYHNFNPRLPVREHGQSRPNTASHEKYEMCGADLSLLDECDMLVALNLGNDPGTLIEIGLAKGAGKPVVVYDPFEKAKNLMLTHLPDFVSSSLDGIVTKVFEIISTIRHAASQKK